MVIRSLCFGGFLLFFAVDVAAEPEIWLARTAECNSCELFEAVSERRGYGEILEYQSGETVHHIPIRTVSKDSLADEIMTQLSEAVRENRHWDIMLTVLVVDDGEVLAQGNIAESADNREMRHSEATMFPPASPRDDHPVFAEEDVYTPFFIENWNLEYFAAVALGDREPRRTSPMVDLSSPNPVSTGRANVILWGSAGSPLSNTLFIPTRIREIRSLVDGLNIDSIDYTTLYGHGPDVAGNDTSYISGGKVRFRKADLSVDLAADAEGLNRVLTGIRRSPDSRSLLIQVGHSGPSGSPLWSSPLTLQPEDLAPLEDESAGELVMVSGGCHSGLFASVGQCSFFAAHPDVLAAGCQLSPDVLAESDDYLRHFFQAATGETQSDGENGIGTRTPTLYAAHWYATERLEDHQISYTSTDALVDEYFDLHPEDLPESMTVGEMLALGEVLNETERWALERLTTGLPRELAVSLRDYVDRNHEAQEKLSDSVELSSVERNQIVAMDYKLALPQLAKRLIYKSLDVVDEGYAAVNACEQQSIPEFFN